ncbi:a53 [Rat cytomegalovirus ALL-03]|uniref:A53 n=2 Tax=Rat cytomegalovirus (isolate England) TaxID=1261657 RepID=A0A0F6TG17_RCMVE|nr:E53 [Murid betaherpesvirus 8]AKE44230.1 a53 [Rat cytomegalovirus ALL-03]AFX83377.1 E53 [Murid betaherpesvirus 8]WEG71850.1 nuclear egress lamina protein [Murid betaherpesvirus 8]WPH25240.1 nuclear egress lamina protein [Murid betaherpesvirus 8]WPH25373.1 nuclear egress lamina protein [Murid betaherpesvirus 8]
MYRPHKRPFTLCASPDPRRKRGRTPPRSISRFRSKRPSTTPPPEDKEHTGQHPYKLIKLSDLHAVFQSHPDLEQKYLKMMRLPITGKEAIQLPFEFKSHRQHTCLDLSPYGNDQVSRSACTICKDSTIIPTASDSMVAFINQTSNVMKHRKFYYGFRKNMELIKMSSNQPQLFQIYYVVQSCISDILPILHYENEKVHMQLIFEHENVHIPSRCIESILAIAKDLYKVSIDIAHQRLTLTATCLRTEIAPVKIDVLLLQRKVDEMDIPNETNEKFERYSL